MTAGLAGCSSQDSSGETVGSSGDSSETVTFLETPGETPGDTEELWAPFTEYLQSEVDGLELEVKFVDSTSGIGQSLLNDQAELTRSDIVMLANPDDMDVVGIVN